jgi:putative ABC transport system permease protein
MKLRRLFRAATLNLYASRQRSLLAVLGIVIGIASVIAMVSLGHIARVQARAQFELLGTDVVTLQASRRPRRVEGFSLSDARQIAERVPFVIRAATRVESNVTVRFGSINEARQVFGVDPEELDVQRHTVRHGRFLTPFDRDQRVCVAGAALALALEAGGQALRLGDWIKVDGQPFRLVGVLNDKHVGGLGDRRLNDALYIPVEFALRSSGSPDISTVTVQFAPGIPTSLGAGRLVDLLTQAKGGAVEFHTFSPDQLLKQMEDQLRMMTLLLGIIASISLIVGGVGVMNVMLVSVTERRKEIGVRRALGARRRDIQLLFLMESGLLTAVGGVGGAIVGIAATYIVSAQAGWAPLFTVAPVAVGVGVSVSLGVFFGWYPARKASELPPMEAMRG